MTADEAYEISERLRCNGKQLYEKRKKDLVEALDGIMGISLYHSLSQSNYNFVS